MIHPKTLGQGSVWSTLFSHDPQEKYLYVADGQNGKIWILDRKTGMEVGSIGHKGHQAGQFNNVERMALDSKGNLYVTEVGPPNTRLQKFVPVK
jgi:DNA-binding beta-propeller fold protein YncE